LADISAAAIARNANQRDARPDQSAGEAVPEPGIADQDLHLLARNETEVPKIYFASGQQSKSQLVAAVTKSKQETNWPVPSLSADQAAGIAFRRNQQALNVAGPILTIGVHDQSGVEPCLCTSFDETDGDRPLMTNIASQPDDFYPADTAQRRKWMIDHSRLDRPIIDDEKGKLNVIAHLGCLYLADQPGERDPIIKYRNDYGDTHLPSIRLD
jgi:hypothetical protein